MIKPTAQAETRETRGSFAAIEGPRERERLPTVIAPDHDDLVMLLADRIAERIRDATAQRGRCVLGLATGSTPIGIYRELVRRYDAGALDFSAVVTFNLDEYYPMAGESLHSYRRYMMEHLFSRVNIPPENIHLLDGTTPRHELEAACADYERHIVAAGGVDFQLLGIGRTGHVGFNEPGSPDTSRTRLVTLDTVTRRDAAADFFGEDNVPREAITMGVGTILDAREIALIATGEHKAPIVRRTVEGPVSTDVPATFLQRHPHATCYLDLPAAGRLTRIDTPWVLGPVDWTPRVRDRAVVWLAGQVKKAILKLNAADYADHHLSPLLARHGGPGPLNGEVFNRLRSKIRGRRLLPSRKRVLIFSPHPDDDVISMGGILRKLVANENHITVAYMTSGNIAVFDHDVRRHLDFVMRAARGLGLDTRKLEERHRAIEDDLGAKAPGQPDTPLIQDLKRGIRESEAVAALAAVGLAPHAARFLNLPFYQTGAVQKRPVGPEDVRIVRQLIEEVQPELLFVAGDLSDPHGTHRMCKAAVDGALQGYTATDPEIWLYRGAWEEWSVTEADALVPVSPDELRAKILAIFRHQSQKDTAPFPGGYDDREFWQRVEARNLATAAEADRLGLPEYYAMEAFVIRGPHASA